MFLIIWIVLFFLTFLVTFIFTPLLFVFNPIYLSFWIVLIGTCIASMLLSGTIKNIRGKEVGMIPFIVNVILGLVLFILFLIGLPIFQSGNYFNSIGKIEEGNFSQDVPEISMEDIRLIDQNQAAKLGDKVLGDEGGTIGSQVNVGNYNIQRVNNKLYWVAPLEHSGFFKYLSNSSGTIGYIMVSANNSSDVKLVKDKKIKYLNSSYFGSYLKRTLQFSTLTQGITDITFEIDDEGNPYWVGTLYEPMVGFFEEDIIGVVVLNATTGEVKKYNIGNTPSWIDRIQPENTILKQLGYWGEYVHGFFNFSKKDMKKLVNNSNLSLIYLNDGKSYWYEGITSYGNDKGTIGFTLTNTRTKETKYYKVSGATDDEAKKSAEGIVQEKGYYGSEPILYNISGLPTYVIPLKDNAGLTKQIALVSVKNYDIVGLGENLDSAIRNYKTKISGKENNININKKDINKSLLKLERFGYFTENNTIVYLLKFEGINEPFIASLSNDKNLPIYQVGDSIEINYSSGSQNIYGNIKNLMLQKK